MRHKNLEHQFVRNVPREVNAGILYISMDYATAVHSCCCGCGERVVTPFTPTDWRITFDGESISLHPSVGNWNQKCQSHYIIQRNRVLEAGLWSETQIAAEKRRDKKVKANYYSQLNDGLNTTTLTASADPINDDTQSKARIPVNLWSYLKSLFTG